MKGRRGVLTAALGLIVAGPVAADEPSPASESSTVRLPTIVVEAPAAEDFHQTVLLPSEQRYLPPDPADLLKYAPGAAVNKNGPLSGISQYRGMSGPRVNTLVSGLKVSPACPNWMDPPLSFIPASDLDQVVVDRGITPVSAGSETIGGTIRANPRQGAFGADADFEPHGIVGLGGQTVDRGYDGNALLWISNHRHRFQVSGTYLRGDDFDAGKSEKVVPSEYKRWNAGVGYGFQDGAQKRGLAYSFDKTGYTGTPALPMDVRTIDAHTFRASYGNAFGPVNVEARFHYIDGAHEMDNFSLRSPPRSIRGTPMRRRSEAKATDYAYDLRASMALRDGELRFGTDGWLPKNHADILSPSDPAFEITNFNDVERNRLGFFGEWAGPLAEKWSLLAGARYTWVGSDAGKVGAKGLGMNQNSADLLAAAFNASERGQVDHLFDLSAILSLALSDTFTLELGAARKQRSPSYQERYLWLPLESTAGLADGRTYVGDVFLRPETAYHFDLGLNAESRRFYFTPRVFYKRVDDYIQGTPVTSGPALAFRRTAANMVRGPGFCQANSTHPTCLPLRFTNVDAELFGADASFGVEITDHWRVDGTVSYVRGRRRDVDDNLYRIAPLNGILGLTWHGSKWAVTAEGEFFARQDDVSEVNAEQETDGYALLNLYGQYRFDGSFSIRAGARNLLDSFYQNHLAGINRVIADQSGNPVDLDVGERLPGRGRSFFLRIEYRF
jgi:iron complex outermembrane receptor protein